MSKVEYLKSEHDRVMGELVDARAKMIGAYRYITSPPIWSVLHR